jgi:hypothetical protein
MRSAVFLLCFSLLAIEISARPSAQIENRYLFILDTSLGMKRVSKAAHEAVLELIGSGMQRNMRPGDTFGIWTFNNELSTGPFPMQQWKPQQQAAVVLEASGFLDQLGYENQSRFENVLPALQQVMEASRWLTVILVTDGRTAIFGTPFDEDINSLYRRHYRDLRDARLPFFTLLTARDGKLDEFSVNSSLGPMKFPVPPLEPAPEPSVANTEPPAPSLVLEASPKPVPSRSDPPVLRPQPQVSSQQASNPVSPRVVKSTSPALTSAITTRTSAPPAAPSVENTTKESSSLPVPPPAPARIAPETAGTVPPPASIIPAAAAPVPIPVVAPPALDPPEARPTQPAPTVAIERSPPPLPVQPDRGGLILVESEPTGLAEIPSQEPAEQSLAMTAAPGSSQNQRMMIAAVAFVLCAAGFLCLYIRKSRKASQPSLISRSMNH